MLMTLSHVSVFSVYQSPTMCQALYQCPKHHKNKEGIIIPIVYICKRGHRDGRNADKFQFDFKITAFFPL